MPEAPKPEHETERLAVLHRLEILDTPSELEFDSLTRQLANDLKVPFALISLVDHERQWFKSHYGLPVCETPRASSFCAYTILSDAPLVIEDASNDPRTSDNPLVTDSPGIRAYLGIPIVIQGQRIGSVCAIDLKIRKFTATDIQLAKVYAQWARREIELRNRALLESENRRALAKIASLYDKAPYPLMSIDQTGRVLECNQRASEFWRSTLGGMPNLLNDPRFDGPSIRRTLVQALNDGETKSSSLEFLDHDETRFFLNFEVRVQDQNPNSPTFMVGFQDQTELMYSSSPSPQRDEKSNTSEADFISKLSHEMRNPIQGMVGLLALFKADKTLVDEEHLNSLESCIDTLRGLVDDTLDLERITQGRISIEEGPFHLRKFSNELRKLHCRAIEQKGLSFKFHCSTSSEIVSGDKLRIQQIVSNLLSNATKYTQRGYVKCVLTYRQNTLRIEVEDSGIGISKTLLANLFDPYTQEENSAGDSSKGIGLGLAIVHQLVHLMGGSIGVKSEVGKGSVFSVELPLTEAEIELRSNEPPNLPSLDLKVLAVDDNPVNRFVMGAQLKKLGCTVEVAGDGHDALEALCQRNFDAVLLDCHMPNLDGFQTARAIAAEPSRYGEPKVIALTGSIKANTEQLCLEAGMHAFLRKPVAFAALYSKLKEYTAVKTNA